MYYASNPMNVPMLKEEYRNLKTRKFPVQYYTKKEINRKFLFPKAGALVTGNDLKSILINMHIY